MPKKKVLIVDDSKTIRQQLNFTVSKSGYEVVEAEDGVRGLAVLAEQSDFGMRPDFWTVFRVV